jgi:sRNA-binding regulator protein Hfq
MIRKLYKPNLKEISQKNKKDQKHKPPPPYKTHAENYYYIKQMNNRTQLVIQLIGNETIKGIIEWYDEKCIKVKKLEGGNLILFKHQIKYICKNPDFPDERREKERGETD